MEKVPRKKERKPLKKKRALLALLLVIALSAAGVYFLRKTPRVPALPETEPQPLLLSRGTDDLFSITITPQSGEPYTLISQGDELRLQDDPDAPLRSLILEELLISVGELPAQSLLIDDLPGAAGVTEADFGLNPALSTVEITYRDGETRLLKIGNLAPNEETPQRYCVLAGDPRLYTILTADGVAFLRKKDTLRDFAQPNIDPSLLDRIQISGDTTFDVSYTPSGWLMEAPYRYPVSTVRMENLLSKIKNIGFEACMGDAERMDLAALGLAAPALTVRLTQAATVISGETAEGESVSWPVPQKEYTLLLGDETGQSGVYLIWEGQVFRASNFVLGFWKELSPRDYLLQNPVNFLVNQLNQVSFTYRGKTAAYNVRMVESITENNQIATDEYGQVLYDCAVRREGEDKDMDAASFLSWYTALATLAPDGALPEDYQIQGECQAAIRISNDSLSRLIQFYPYDALHDAMAVDGIALYYVQKDWVNRVVETP